MSLINKMLQDLDARGGAKGGAATGLEVRAVPQRETHPRMLLLGGAALLLVIAAGGWLGWRYWQQHAAPARVVPAPQIKIVQPMPQPVPASASSVAAARPQLQASDAEDQPSMPASAVHHARVRRAHAEGHVPLAQQRPAKPARQAGADSAPAPAPARPQQGNELSLAQQSENAYRRALGSLQEGRVSEAVAGMESALDLNPRNDGARQTLIGLLVENKRNDDAIRNLRLALAIDPGQPPMAMLLARLQMEQGAPASETLLRTLSYAKDNAEYHAFLGTALQREQRNGEAAEQYRAALKLAPQNGVWWMGLGISLQAEQRLPEAKEAYNHAKSTGTLSAELNLFVDRKLQQLPR
jgi:MSHA biogenesis protein MshN